jgi:hypothetical protein
MRLTSSSIQRLLKGSERALVDAVSASNLKNLSAAKLRSTVARARTLQDKYATDAQASTTKAAAFGVVLERLEKQLERVERQTARRESAPAASRKKTALSRKPAAARKSAATRKRTPVATAKKTASPRRTTRRSTTTARKRAATPARQARPTMAERRAAAEQQSKAELKARARELVATVRERVAQQEGAPAAVVAELTSSAMPIDGQAAEAATVAAEAEAMQAQSADAAASAVERRLAASHLTRLQGHARGRGQRAQGRRDNR